MPSDRTTLLVEVDSELAAEYKAAYEQTMGGGKPSIRSLAEFISRFVIDRLVEELEFVQTDYARDSR